MTYHENPSKKVFCIDFDHTLTADAKGTYSEYPDPNWNMIKAINRIYRQGNIIIIWTARQWDTAHFLISWLIKYSVHFHGVMMGKGGADFYIEDKAIRPEEFLKDF